MAYLDVKLHKYRNISFIDSVAENECARTEPEKPFGFGLHCAKIEGPNPLI